MQYARVLVVVLLTPLLIPILFPGHHGVAPRRRRRAPLLGTASDWLLTLAIARRRRLGRACACASRRRAARPDDRRRRAHALRARRSPARPLLRETAFAVIGLQVGLRFTVETVRQVGRLLVPVLL